jgi:spore coat polysaccharide biosynthesis protein SpsF (cytidylyltransferase family)
MKFLAVVAARTGSSRFPGKVLFPIGGVPVLSLLIRRLSTSKKLDGILVATTELAQDDEIEKTCQQENAECFRGSEKDVLGRYAKAAKGSKDRRIIRITADCPFVSGETLDPVLRQCEENPSFALVTTKPEYPRGIDYEVAPFQVIEELSNRATDPPDREHMFNYLYRHPLEFPIMRLPCPKALSSIKREFLLDTKEDLTSLEQSLGSLSPLEIHPSQMKCSRTFQNHSGI